MRRQSVVGRLVQQQVAVSIVDRDVVGKAGDVRGVVAPDQVALGVVGEDEVTRERRIVDLALAVCADPVNRRDRSSRPAHRLLSSCCRNLTRDVRTPYLCPWRQSRRFSCRVGQATERRHRR